MNKKQSKNSVEDINKDSVLVEGITILINGDKISLTVEQAKKLKLELENLLGSGYQWYVSNPYVTTVGTPCTTTTGSIATWVFNETMKIPEIKL